MLFCSVDPYLLYKVGGVVQGNILHHNKQHKKEKTGLGPPTCGSYAEFFSVRETNPPIRDQKGHQGPPKVPPTCGSYAEFFFGPGNKPSHPGPKGPSGTTKSTPYMRKLCWIFLPRAALGPISPPRNTRGNTLHHYKQQTTQKKQLLYLI